MVILCTGWCFVQFSYPSSLLGKVTLVGAKKLVQERLQHCTTLSTVSRMINEEDERSECSTFWSRCDITVRLVGAGRRTTRGAWTRRTTPVSSVEDTGTSACSLTVVEYVHKLLSVSIYRLFVFSVPSPVEHQICPAVCVLMKLSFDEEHRHAMNELGELVKKMAD